MVVLEGRIVTHDKEWNGQLRSTTEGLELGKSGTWNNAVRLPTTCIIIPGMHDVHAHPRDGPIPSPEQYEAQRLEGEKKIDPATDYENLKKNIHAARTKETFASFNRRAILGGVARVGCQLNIPWRPFTEQRFLDWRAYARGRSDIIIEGFPVMDTGTLPFDHGDNDYEYKDFGATFGGRDVTRAETRALRANYAGKHISYHTEATEGLPPIEPGQTFHEWLCAEYEIRSIEDAIMQDNESPFARVTHMHVSTAKGLELVKEAYARTKRHFAQFTMDHTLFDIDAAKDQAHADWVYRRPPLRTFDDQGAILDAIRDNPPWLMYGSDHAPHTPEDKTWKNGKPGAPGTPCLELTGQFFVELHDGFSVPLSTLVDLFCRKPARWLEPVTQQKQPFGVIQDGAAPYLTVINLDDPHTIKEGILRNRVDLASYWTHFDGDFFQGRAYGVVIRDKLFLSENPA